MADTTNKCIIFWVLSITITLVGAISVFYMFFEKHGVCYKPIFSAPLPELIKSEFVGIYTWEGDTVVEPTVLYMNGTYHMWYRGGPWYGPSSIGHATSVDGIQWIRRVNPVVVGGYQPAVQYRNNEFVMHYTTLDTRRMTRATSTDGITWTTTLSQYELPEGGTQFGNRVQYTPTHILQEIMFDGVWEVWVYNDTRPLKKINIPNYCGGMTGGPDFHVHGNRVDPTTLLYHAALGEGNLPTGIFEIGFDVEEVTVTGNPRLLVFPPIGHDQAADPVVLHVPGGEPLLFYDIDNNKMMYGSIRISTQNQI